MDHHKLKEEFLAAIQYTAAITGFRSELIEKDYFCSLVLSSLYDHGACPLIFKGGTLLSKVYGDFYRLSEDLDFSYDVPFKTNRSERREISLIIKKIFHQIEKRTDGINISVDLKGSDESRQYNGELTYKSQVTSDQGSIKFEVSLRDKLLDNLSKQNAKTLILNPFTGQALVNPHPIACYSKEEAYAEKIRAAFCREAPAIRDFYDISYAINKNIIDLHADNFSEIVRSKISSQSNSKNITNEMVKLLQNQLLTDLFPTLRSTDFNDFDLNKVIKKLQELYEKILLKQPA